MRRLLLLTAVVALGLGGPACGGGARERTVNRQFLFGPIVNTTGYMTQQAAGGPLYIPSVDVPVRIGDNADNDQTKGYVSFDIASLPDNAQVTYAVLRMTQSFVAGIPYGVLGPGIVVDQVDLGGSLDEGDWTGNSLGIGIGTLSTEPALRPYEVEVSQEVAFALTLNRSTVDFRLYFPQPTDADANPDHAEFTKAGELAQPVLEVTALVPNR